MRTLRRTALSLLSYGVLLTGCQVHPTPVRLTQVRVPVPAALLRCQNQPLRPGPEATQRDAALVILDLQEALEDCKINLAAVAELIGNNP